MIWKINLGLFVILLIYLTVGALVFYVLEFKQWTPSEITQSAFYKEFLANHTGVTASDLEMFTRGVVQAYSDGAVVGNASQIDNGWTYDNAVYFAITVVSTIGYGHITPKTTGGKAFCIFYALVGIPLAAALMASIGTRLRRPIEYLHRTKPWCRGNPVRDRHLKSAVVLTLGTVFMLCVPALVFVYTENWDYLTALYYSTITLTTVGFGDYVAGADVNRHVLLHRILLCIWLIVGLAYVAMVLSEVSAIWSGERDKEEDSSTPSDSASYTGRSKEKIYPTPQAGEEDRETDADKQTYSIS